MSEINLGDAPEAGSGSKIFNGNIAGRITDCVLSVVKTTADKKADNPKLPDYNIVIKKRTDVASGDGADASYISLGLFLLSTDGRTPDQQIKDKKKFLTTLRHLWEVCSGRAASELSAETNNALLHVVMRSIKGIQDTRPIQVNVMANFGTTHAPASRYVSLRKFAPFIEPVATPEDKTALRWTTIEHTLAGIPDAETPIAAPTAGGSTDAPAVGTSEW